MYFYQQEDTVSGKRSAGGQGDGTRAKAPKKDLSASDIEEAIRNGRVSNLK